MFQNKIEQKIIPFLKKSLPAERFRHILSVMELSESLAKKHGLSVGRARLAAALHDAARRWNDRRLLNYVRKNRLKIPHLDFIAKHQRVLLHSFVSADLARKLFGIRDREILSAIAKHSVASTKMSPSEKLIYVADFSSPDRKFPDAKRVRQLAHQDLNAAFLESLRLKMLHLIQSGSLLHPDAAEIWNHFAGR